MGSHCHAVAFAKPRAHAEVQVVRRACITAPAVNSTPAAAQEAATMTTSMVHSGDNPSGDRGGGGDGDGGEGDPMLYMYDSSAPQQHCSSVGKRG